MSFFGRSHAFLFFFSLPIVLPHGFLFCVLSNRYLSNSYTLPATGTGSSVCWEIFPCRQPHGDCGMDRWFFSQKRDCPATSQCGRISQRAACPWTSHCDSLQPWKLLPENRAYRRCNEALPENIRFGNCNPNRKCRRQRICGYPT